MESVVVLHTLPRVTMPLSTFLVRLTAAERIAMRTSSVPEVVDVYETLMTMEFVDVSSAFMADSVAILVENNVLTTARAVTVMEGL